QYNIEVLVDEKKIQQLGLTLGQVTQAIRSFNNNVPLGNYVLGDFRYDYRIKGKVETLSELMDIPITIGNTNQGPRKYVRLADIASVQRDYKDDSASYGGIAKDGNNVATTVVIYKANRSNIFENAGEAKALINKELQKPMYAGIKTEYTTDLSEIIIEDYASLGSNALQSVLLIFLIMWLFIGLKQSLIATFAMPLSFFITFIVLNWMGYTLNFLTNFSLVLTFGMGIDTVVVIIEAAYELMKKGYNAKTAILLAMKQYAQPNMTSSIANMIVFLPMLALPGITGKFLAYIPITIFITLAASLFLASSINNAIFWKLNNNQKYYFKPADYKEGEDEEILLSDEDKELLKLEQAGKEARESEDQPATDKFINKIAHRYSTKLHRILERRFWRRRSYIGPVVALILSFILLSGSIGFTLFPSGDNEFMNIAIETKQGATTESMIGLAPKISQIISSIPELRNFNITVSNNTISIAVRLVKKNQRDKNSFEVQDDILAQLAYLKEKGYIVESKVQEGGPPTGKAVGIQIVADDTSLLNDLKKVSTDFEQYLKSLEGTMNVTNSSKNNPGQFEFTRDNNKLAQLGLTPSDFQNELLSALLGQNAGTLSLEKKDRDIIVKYKGFASNLTPEAILSTVISTKNGPIMLGSVAEYSINQALSSLSRKDGDITISVESDLELGKNPTDYQPKLVAFAQTYQFPSGVSYKAGGENAENAELIQATLVAFMVAIFLIFLVLVYQFNSFSQSIMILYSIITALLGVNIGLWITGNPYSMPFMIGFISLIGIVVNNAIFIIDKINSNLKLGAPILEAIIDAGKTRFKPVIISSLTTILGIITLAFKDEFWAGLARTVVFGLLFSSVMTLISVPNLYYTIYNRKNKHKI
ncbi:MAG: efflux RND transporter permease subunit, partial [Candidatus Absconditabacterales bacterium]